MAADTPRILTTHVGSLNRPDDLIAFLRQIDAKDPSYDEDAHMECLARPCATSCAARRRPASTSSATASTASPHGPAYIYERLGRHRAAAGASRGRGTSRSVNDNPTDWARFPEFYAEYFGKEQEYEGPAASSPAWPRSPTRARAISRDIANLKAAMEAEGVEEGFLPVVAPPVPSPRSSTSTTAARRRPSWASPRRCAEEYKAIVDAGPARAGRRRLHPVHVRRHRPAGDDRRLPRVGAAAHRRAQPRTGGHPEDRVATTVLGLWNGPHTNDIALRDILDLMFQVNGQDVLVRERQPAPRARVEGVGGRRAARRQAARAGGHLHATNVVEHPELVAERLERVARLVGIENVVGSTDCGFAQGP